MEAILIFGFLFLVSICWIFQQSESDSHEPVLPDESDVIGKDLPVGFRFMKDGKVVEVVEAVTPRDGCKGCIYKYPECISEGSKMLCCTHERSKRDSVIFKYIDHE